MVVAAVVVAVGTYGLPDFGPVLSYKSYLTPAAVRSLSVAAMFIIFFQNNTTHESFLENASTNCIASGGIENEYSLDAMQWRKAVHSRRTIQV